MSPRRIGLLGGESTGKSTLADDLARALPAFVAEEYLRDFVRDYGRLPRRDDQEGILLTQAATVATVERAADHSGTPWVIADPLPLMTAVYSIVYFDDDSLLPAGLQDAHAYDALLWCAPDIPWRADGNLRDGDEIRATTERVIAEVVAPALAAGRLHRIEGTREARVAASLRIVGELG